MNPIKVAIIGGGLAGLAAALRLAEHGLAVELFEARRTLGGRAASYRDPQTGELVDHCQHVSMACCTNFRDFCQRTGIASEFQRARRLHFFSPGGRRHDLAASGWVPAPFHLGPALLRQAYLSWSDRLHIARLLLKLAWLPDGDGDTETVGRWLRSQGASQAAIDRFWSVVLVSALGESVDRASLAAARKVFVDGFLAHRQAFVVDVPRRSLRELFDEGVARHLQDAGVILHRQTPVKLLAGDAAGVKQLELPDERPDAFDSYVLATPWRRTRELLSAELQAALPELAEAEQFGASPISGVHLWFDRPIMSLPHAVLVDRLTQWVFRRELQGSRHYYQAVISASHDLSGRPAECVVADVVTDLQAVFPEARSAKLLACKLVTEREAVFSYRPGLDRLRPSQRTNVPNLFLAGDWTQTGWPSTLEGAVRSGYLAAEGVLHKLGARATLLAPDLPRPWLARILLGDGGQNRL